MGVTHRIDSRLLGRAQRTWGAGVGGSGGVEQTEQSREQRAEIREQGAESRAESGEVIF